jgi:hypothetical protein
VNHIILRDSVTELLNLPAPPPFAVPSVIYRKALETFQVTLTDGAGFARQGDTHFGFNVPERAFEDREVVREAIRIGLLTDRLAAALLMTDFANPVFSARRAALLRHAPARASVSAGGSDFSEQMANTIVAAANDSPDASPEREFADRWAAGEAWRERFGELLSTYYEAVSRKLSTQEGFEAYMRLAESRRDRVRRMPIFESPLLFARTNIPSAERSMRPDATVEEA